jgi:teichuronic acid biosynthesis glycosyltransferase TuaC
LFALVDKDKVRMRCLWVHNFAPTAIASGQFMHILFDRMAELGADIAMHYTGSLRGIGKIASSTWRVRQLSRQFDIVHAQYGSATGYAVSFAAGRKMLSLRGTDLLGRDDSGALQYAHAVCNRWFTRHSLRSYDTIVVMSQRMKAGVLKLYPSARVEVLPDGIDLQRFQPMNRQEARRRLGEGDDQSPWILVSSVAGVNSALKRIPLAMEAVRVVQSCRPNVKLKFLSGQPHDRVPLWVNASDAVLLTSTQEGWPNIIKEALACNVPFVSTDVSDVKAVADAEPSCTVADANPKMLAEGVLKAFQIGRPESLRPHVQGMDLDVVAKRLMKLYENICGSQWKTS